MADGICDVPGCSRETYMGWRPLKERIGHQVCELHWNGHKAGTFDLYDAFGFKRPRTMTKHEAQRQDDIPYEDKEHWDEILQPKDDTLLRECPECHRPKLKPRQRYCDSCKGKRRLKTKRGYQRKFRKLQNVCA